MTKRYTLYSILRPSDYSVTAFTLRIRSNFNLGVRQMMAINTRREIWDPIENLICNTLPQDFPN
jgi:hypothetical protein